MRCTDCDQDYEPFAIIEAFVETASPITHLDDDGFPRGYEPTGSTEVEYDTQQEIGYGCHGCGEVIITRPIIGIAGLRFILHAETDRYGR